MRVAAPRAPDKRRRPVPDDVPRLAARLAPVVWVGVVAVRRLVREHGQEGVPHAGRVLDPVARRDGEVRRRRRAVALLHAQRLKAVLAPLVVLPRDVVALQEAQPSVARRMLGVAPVAGRPLDRAEAVVLSPVDLAQHGALALADDLGTGLNLAEPPAVRVVLRAHFGKDSALVDAVVLLDILTDPRDVVGRAPDPFAGVVVQLALVRPVLHDVVKPAYLPQAYLAGAPADVDDLPRVLEGPRRLLPHNDAHPVLHGLDQKRASAFARATDGSGSSVGRHRRAHVAAQEEPERRRGYRDRPFGHHVREAGDLPLPRSPGRYPEPERAERGPLERVAVPVFAAVRAFAAFATLYFGKEPVAVVPPDVRRGVGPHGLAADADRRRRRVSVDVQVDRRKSVSIAEPAPGRRNAVARPRAAGAAAPSPHEAPAVERIFVLHGVFVAVPQEAAAGAAVVPVPDPRHQDDQVALAGGRAGSPQPRRLLRSGDRRVRQPPYAGA